MGIYSKEAYAGKREWAARKQAKSSKLAQEQGLSEEQTDAIEWLCQLRHEFHSADIGSMYAMEGEDYNMFTGDMDDDAQEHYDTLKGLGLGEPWDASTLAMDLPCCLDWDQVLDDEEKAKYEDEYDYREHALEHLEEWKEKINASIEDFLKKIDEKFGTEYCPSGCARATLI